MIPRPVMTQPHQTPMNPWAVAAERGNTQPQQIPNYWGVSSPSQPAVRPPPQPIPDYWGVAAATTVQSQTTNAITTLVNELSTGNGNRPPKMLDMSEYHSWQKRFKIHLEGISLDGGEAWQMIVKGYVAPMIENSNTPIALDDQKDGEKKKYAAEKKAYSQLSQALTTDLLHQFGTCATSKQLWEALKSGHDRNDKTRRIRFEELKKEF